MSRIRDLSFGRRISTGATRELGSNEAEGRVDAGRDGFIAQPYLIGELCLGTQRAGVETRETDGQGGAVAVLHRKNSWRAVSVLAVLFALAIASVASATPVEG